MINCTYTRDQKKRATQVVVIMPGRANNREHIQFKQSAGQKAPKALKEECTIKNACATYEEFNEYCTLIQARGDGQSPKE